ncbi:MAG: GvpL/GvpF family gas vesicle protein [Parcubacteria group bacterium]|nr:GvpL/GvpF family gas vesicle protein [Parcubacteria group bacterium]
MNKGLYLYCIRAKASFGFSAEGIGGGKIFIIPYQDLEAVISEVCLEEFGSGEIQKKAQEDLGWIKRKAQIHEKIIEEAMGIRKENNSQVVIPMKFGSIFKTKKKLEEILDKHHSKFKRILKNLAGKQEWAVKVYLSRKAFEKEIKKVSPVVQEKEKEIAKFPEGMAYFMQKQIDESVAKEADKAIEKYIGSFFENLKEYAITGIKGNILEKELTGKSLPMVLNAIFLILEERLEDFIKQVDKLNQEYKTKGFYFEYSGPWPPYNFI